MAGRETPGKPLLSLGLSFLIYKMTGLSSPRLLAAAPKTAHTSTSGEEGYGDRRIATGLDVSTGLQENEQRKNEASSTSTQGSVPIHPISQLVVLKLEE